MSTFSASHATFTQEQAVWLSNYYKSCHSDYTPDFQEEDTLIHFSANYLDRKFTEGSETFIKRNGQEEKHFIKTDVVIAFMNGLHMIREAVAVYCDSYDYIDSYGPFSPLYARFFKAQIAYPIEYHCIFHEDEYLTYFDDFDDLLAVVQRAQLWSIFMIAALHCLALYDGLSPAEVCATLPPLNHGHLFLARRSHHRVLEEQAAIMANAHQAWDLPTPPYSPVIYSESPGWLSSDEEDALPSPPSPIEADDEFSFSSEENVDNEMDNF